MIDISKLTIQLDGIDPSLMSYAATRPFFPVFNNLLNDTADASGLNDWINLGNSSIQNQLATYQAQMSSYGGDINDTSSHAPDANYSNWPAFRDFCLQIAVEANAVEEGTGHVAYDVTQSIAVDIPTAAANVYTAIKDAAPTVALGLGGLALVAVAVVAYIVLKR